MFSLFIILLSFSISFACGQRKCLFLIDDPFMVRPTGIDKNPVEFIYYPLVISIDKYTRNCNFVFQKKQKTYILKHLIC